MIKLPAYLTGFGSKSDGSASVRFSTQEITDDEFLEIKKHQNLFGWLLFTENDINLKDVPKEQAIESNKTPAKRLRDVLYILHKQSGSEQDYETYYRNQMNKMIDIVKAKLD